MAKRKIRLRSGSHRSHLAARSLKDISPPTGTFLAMSHLWMASRLVPISFRGDSASVDGLVQEVVARLTNKGLHVNFRSLQEVE